MVNSSVISMDSTLYKDPGQNIHNTLYPLAGIGRPVLFQHSTSSGHDVTGPDINLDLLEAHFGCTALLGSSNVEPNSSPNEK
jgi:hypothetical protein